jgi:hypothetical protein
MIGRNFTMVDVDPVVEAPDDEITAWPDAEEALLEDDEVPLDSIPRLPPPADADARSDPELRDIETAPPERYFSSQSAI